MTDLLNIIKGLLLGEGNPRDIGIRALIFLVGTLTAMVGKYIRRDIERYGESLDKYGKSLHNIDENAKKMDAAFTSYKDKLKDMLDAYLGEFRKDIHELKLTLTDHSGKLTKNTLELESYQGLLKHESANIRSAITFLEHRIDETIAHLKQSHETREEVYGLIRDLRRMEEKQEQGFGKIVLIESRFDRYHLVLQQLERSLAAKKNKTEPPKS